MPSQLYNIGDVIQAGTKALEVTAISSQDGPDGEPINFAYTIRLQSDVDAERAAEAKAIQEAEDAAAAAEAAQAGDAPAEQVAA